MNEIETCMDSKLISTLKTVRAAGHAREGFNGDSNEQLRSLADVGLLVVSQAPGLIEHRRRTYKPTQKGWALYKEMADKVA